MRCVAKALALLFGLWCLVTGFMDLDWMFVANHFDMWNAQKDVWEFCPFFTMNWWNAYVFCLIRIVIGVAIATYMFIRNMENNKNRGE